MVMLDDKDFLSIKEFACKMRLHPNTVRRSIKKGKLNALRVGVGKTAIYRIPASEMNRLALVNMEEVIEKLIEKKMLS